MKSKPLKIKESVDLAKLEKFGFELIDDNYLQNYGIDEYDHLFFYRKSWVYELGHGRRGQFYYYIVTEKKELLVFASKPDGSGASVSLDYVIINLYNAGLIELE